jgi:hypothetical protein
LEWITVVACQDRSFLVQSERVDIVA